MIMVTNSMEWCPSEMEKYFASEDSIPSQTGIQQRESSQTIQRVNQKEDIFIDGAMARQNSFDVYYDYKNCKR